MIYKSLKYMLYLLFLPFWWIQYFIPRTNSVWVFGAWYGAKFSDNSRYLYLYILNNHPEIKAVWLTRNRNVKRKVKKAGGVSHHVHSLLGVWYSLVAKQIIISSGKRDVNYLFINGANKVQLWHGSPLKKIGLDDKFANFNSYFHKKIVPVFFPFIYEFNYDFVASNAKIFSPIMASAFNVSIEQILETGCPRNDIYYSHEISNFNNDLRVKFKDCKLVYYLPTFRNYKGAKSLLNLNDFDNDKIELLLEEENIVFVSKGHYVDNTLNKTKENSKGRIIHLSDDNVDDTSFLLKDADLLITDYSGAYFDFLLTEKPLIFAAFDLEDYKTSSRELYFDYEKAVAGPIVKNWSELLDSLRTIWNDENYSDLVKEKNAEFNKYHDAENSRRVFESILKIN